MTRKEFKDKVFPQNLTDPEIIIDQDQAINIAVQLMLMIDCSDKDRHCEGYKIGGFRPVSWEDSERLQILSGGLFQLMSTIRRKFGRQ
jgi:hypothetical protein